MELNDVVPLIQSGKIGVLPTDTVYGLVCSAFEPAAVERIYNVKKRDLNKPLVIIISDLSDLEQLKISLTDEIKIKLDQLWPGPVSVILPCKEEKFNYLHRGSSSLAVRLPSSQAVRHFVNQTGPLATTSANLEGQAPATIISQAKEYFKDSVDFYVDGGELSAVPSALVRLDGQKLIVLRRGELPFSF